MTIRSRLGQRMFNVEFWVFDNCMTVPKFLIICLFNFFSTRFFYYNLYLFMVIQIQIQAVWCYNHLRVLNSASQGQDPRKEFSDKVKDILCLLFNTRIWPSQVELFLICLMRLTSGSRNWVFFKRTRSAKCFFAP